MIYLRNREIDPKLSKLRGQFFTGPILSFSVLLVFPFTLISIIMPLETDQELENPSMIGSL